MNKRRQKRRSNPKGKVVFVEQGGRLQLPPTLTPIQLAKLLQCSRQHITNHCQSGAIKAQRLGQLWFIPRPEVERLIGMALPAAK
jgi:excisionase family DNA binding protein